MAACDEVSVVAELDDVEELAPAVAPEAAAWL